MNNNYDLCLASASPRRAELIAQIGLKPAILPVDIDESVESGESAADYVRRLAKTKSMTGFERQTHDQLTTLGSDTSVVIDGEILGKPRDEEHAIQMLQQLSGRTHEVYTGVAITGKKQDFACTKAATSLDSFESISPVSLVSDTKLICVNVVHISQVSFKVLSIEECKRYWETGEPADKAGAYGIQALGATFVRHLSGSFTGVMGLPLYESSTLLECFNISMMRQ